jgi:two-component system chemotaxis sensor kinase CheA
MQVVVATHRGHTVGIVVDRILDIVQDKLEIRRRSTRYGMLGSAVIQNKITDLLDVHGIVAQACAELEDAA